jgi:hypothetical protein
MNNFAQYDNSMKLLDFATQVIKLKANIEHLDHAELITVTEEELEALDSIRRKILISLSEVYD